MSNGLIPIPGDGTPKRLPPRIKGIETAEGGLEIGEPGAIPGVEPRIIRKAIKQTAPVNSAGIVNVAGPRKPALNRPLTQQEAAILSRRSNRVR